MNATLASASLADLVAHYNTLTGESVKRFADRATALRRIAKAEELAQAKGQIVADAAQLRAIEAQVDAEVADTVARGLRIAEAAAAERQAQAEDAQRAAEPAKAERREGDCPKCGADRGDITGGQCIDVRGRQETVNEHQMLCHSCGFEWDANTGKAIRRAPKVANPEGRRAAIAASWKDAAVAAARATRHAVQVGGKDYPSVRMAFIALGLPLSRHIKFRGQLKAAGKATFEGHEFTLVPIAE